MTHMLSLEEQMTGLKRKPSELPGDQPPPKLLKQTTDTTLDTALERESDIDNIPPPVLEKADTYTDDRPIAFPYGKVNDEGSNNSTPPPVLPRFPTLTPTKPVSEKYFGFEIDESDEEDDSFSKIAQSINIGEDSLDNISSGLVEPKTACIGTNTVHDIEENSSQIFTNLKKADTMVIMQSNGSNEEGKKNKVIKKTLGKKVLTPKKNVHNKKELEIVKEKSVTLDSLESLKTIQKMPSGTLIEKIMKFGEQEIMLPSNPSLAEYETKEGSASGSGFTTCLPRPSFLVVSEVLQSIDEDNKQSQVDSGIPRLEYVSSEDLTASEQSDIDTSAPTLQKTSTATPTKSPKKFIHGGIREIVFSFDTTGSMYSYMEEAKDRMREIVERLKIDIPGVRLAFIAHGDYFDLKNDRYLIKSLDFGASIDEICNFFEYLPITHGGDADECYELVLRKVRESLSWTTGSQRCLVMIGDSDPHEPGYTYEEFTNDIDWKEETKKLNDMGVRIYGTQVGYRSDFYRQISQITGGAHLRLESANRTPDMLLAVCLREGNLKLLKTFEGEVLKRQDNKDDIDLELARLFSSLKNVPDNIAMKFKQKLIDGEENGKKAVKRSNDSSAESPGSKIAKLAKKNLSPELKKKKSTSDQIAKSLVKKAIKGTKEKSKATLPKDKKLLLKKAKLADKQKSKLKSVRKSPAGKLKQLKKTPDAKKKQIKPVASLKKTKQLKSSSNVKKLKALKDAKLKKTIPKGKQTATKLKAKAVVKALLKSKKKDVADKPKSKIKAQVKGKKLDIKTSPKKNVTKLGSKPLNSKKNQNVAKTKLKKDTVNKTNKTKVKGENAKTKKPEKKPKDTKKTTKTTEPKAKKEVKKKPVKDTPKKTPSKKSNDKTVQVKKPKNLQPREIASIAKFVQGPLSCLSWEQWVPLIAHEKKTGNWSKGKNGCPGFCNSDFNKQKTTVPVVYEFAVSPPDSSKKYPVYFHSESDNVWELCKDKFVLGEIERVIKAKGSVSVRIGTVNKDDGALFLKTVEHLKNMFDYAWNSNSSKETARKQNLVKEGFIVAKV